MQKIKNYRITFICQIRAKNLYFLINEESICDRHGRITELTLLFIFVCSEAVSSEKQPKRAYKDDEAGTGFPRWYVYIYIYIRGPFKTSLRSFYIKSLPFKSRHTFLVAFRSFTRKCNGCFLSAVSISSDNKDHSLVN